MISATNLCTVINVPPHFMEQLTWFPTWENTEVAFFGWLRCDKKGHSCVFFLVIIWALLPSRQHVPPFSRNYDTHVKVADSG